MHRLSLLKNSPRGLVLGFLAMAALGLVLTGCGASQEKAATKIPRVGFLSVSAVPSNTEALKESFRELGYIEGETIIIEWRITRDLDELPGIVAEFVEQRVRFGGCARCRNPTRNR